MRFSFKNHLAYILGPMTVVLYPERIQDYNFFNAVSIFSMSYIHLTEKVVNLSAGRKQIQVKKKN